MNVTVCVVCVYMYMTEQEAVYHLAVTDGNNPFELPNVRPGAE